MKPHFIAESLITSTVKNALSRTPRQALPATRIRARPRDLVEPHLTAEEERRLIASVRQIHTHIWITLRTMHLQESLVSLVVAQLLFAQHCSCDAMCARVNTILDTICPHDFAQTESSVTQQPSICLKNSSVSSDRSSKTLAVNSCRQPPSHHSKTQSVNGMEESGRHMQDG